MMAFESFLIAGLCAFTTVRISGEIDVHMLISGTSCNTSVYEDVYG